MTIPMQILVKLNKSDVVILLRGMDKNVHPIFAFVQVNKKALQAFTHHIKLQQALNWKDHGTILLSGYGEPAQSDFIALQAKLGADAEYVNHY